MEATLNRGDVVAAIGVPDGRCDTDTMYGVLARHEWRNGRHYCIVRHRTYGGWKRRWHLRKFVTRTTPVRIKLKAKYRA